MTEKEKLEAFIWGTVIVTGAAALFWAMIDLFINNAHEVDKNDETFLN